MRKQKVSLIEIIKITAGGLHCWVDTNIGIIRKKNVDVPESLWKRFKKK